MRGPRWLHRRSLPAPHPRTPWRAAEFCVIDLETTGLDLRRDEIVAYGAAIVCQARIPCGRTAYGLVRPARSMSVAALKVHGLRAADLADAPTIGETADELAGLLANRVVVAHAAWIERAFLNRVLRPRGTALGRAVLDTAALLRACRLADVDSSRVPDLETASRALGLPVHTPHHALGDAFTTAQLFLALATRLERTRAGNNPRPLTVRELCAISRHYSP
ncbi:3'-5' exonuclease [Actinoplanes sp. KI2]|uniref:3'-5' exonuclease n=1 Tax=Actinoplanes sp. KI2 TaxID=2983315 RepID=UPI0021D57A5B|nr:3'-5' exonuclease [Actinoplanes sp. KI2]MCU7731006.1 3'-5' exonuclease [Actinoplanes sp. KI2]